MHGGAGGAHFSWTQPWTIPSCVLSRRQRCDAQAVARPPRRSVGIDAGRLAGRRGGVQLKLVLFAVLLLSLSSTAGALKLRNPFTRKPPPPPSPEPIPASPSLPSLVFNVAQFVVQTCAHAFAQFSRRAKISASLFAVGSIATFIYKIFTVTGPRFFRKRLITPNLALLDLNKDVKGPIAPRKDLEEEFYNITENLEQSVLIWGEHKTGKSTFVSEIVKAETLKGRPVLYVSAGPNQSLKEVLTRLFRWRENDWFRRIFWILTRRGELQLPQTEELSGLHKPHGLPLAVVDNVNLLSTESIVDLLHIAKSFVDARVAVFVFVLSSGRKGRHFVVQSPMTRVEMLYVSDLTETQTISFLTMIGRTETEARQIYGLVGGRCEFFAKAKGVAFDFDKFKRSWFGMIEGKVLGVSATGWDAEDTLSVLFLFLEGDGQVAQDMFVKRTDGSEAAVERMSERNLILFRLDSSKYELHSQLVRAYLLAEKEKRAASPGGAGEGRRKSS